MLLAGPLFLAAVSFALSLIGAAAWCERDAVVIASILATGLFLAAAAAGAVRRSGWIAVVAASAAVGTVTTVGTGVVAVLVAFAFGCPEVG